MPIVNKFVSFSIAGTFIFNIFASAATEILAHRQHRRFGAENCAGNYMDMSAVTNHGKTHVKHSIVSINLMRHTIIHCFVLICSKQLKRRR